MFGGVSTADHCMTMDETTGHEGLSSGTFLLTPEVKIMNEDIVGPSPTSSKARIHHQTIQSYLGLALSDPIRMTGLKNSSTRH